MMKVFISWSGPTSKAVAEALRGWLPKVIQAIEPWVSSEDIEKGTRWSSEIANQLEDSKVGIICVTPDNLTAPWLLFEAGALSKTLQHTLVCPYLFNVEPTDLPGPLAQFQATRALEEGDAKRLIQTLNRALGDNARSETHLNEIFAVWWPWLKQELEDILLEVLPLSIKDIVKAIECERFEQTGKQPDAIIGRIFGSARLVHNQEFWVFVYAGKIDGPYWLQGRKGGNFEESREVTESGEWLVEWRVNDIYLGEEVRDVRAVALKREDKAKVLEKGYLDCGTKKIESLYELPNKLTVLSDRFDPLLASKIW